MRGNITKTEKILLVCTAVFLLAICGVCFAEIAAGRNGSWTLETAYSVPAGELIPPEAGVININTAPAELLTELPGIGETLAARIVEYREVNGPFLFKSQLMQVKGIGEETYRALEDQITVEDNEA